MTHDQVRNPFPGLRPFEFADNYLFFGRDEQITELTTRLRKNRFVAVVGTSGSGKSSLVRAGLMPELLSGTMASAGSSWETTIMRPGGDPLTNLADAIVETDLYDPEEEDIASQIRATLTRSGLGLVETIRQSELPEGTNFLLVVDQFEEIFRFRRSDDATDEQAAFFVNLLLEASAQENLPLYIIITMRSDFLGECSQFPRLADTVNEGEFLIPRLNRDQRKEAIIGPVKVAGGDITDRLLLRLLNDIGDDPDQLPILQHSLMRTWDYWTKKRINTPLDLEDYNATGGMDEALSRHADEVYAELPNDNYRWITQKLFKCLTEKVDENRGVRRPMAFRELCEIIEENEEQISFVINEYRKVGRTFLMPGEKIKITSKTIIDISHESLMRVWFTLRSWVEDESQSARIYRRLADTAKLHSQGKAGLYRNPDLQIAISWKEESKPNKTWADRYYPGFEEAIVFLRQSHDEEISIEKQKEEARKKELENIKALAAAQEQKANAERLSAVKSKRFAGALAVLSVLLMFLAVLANNLKHVAEENEEKVRKSYFLANLREAENLAAQERIPPAIAKLTGIKPDNESELKLIAGRLLSMLSQTFFPKKIDEPYSLNERAFFPDGAILSKDGKYVVILADYNNKGNIHIQDLSSNKTIYEFNDADTVLCIDYAHDKEWVALGYAYDGKNHIDVIDVTTGEIKWETETEKNIFEVVFNSNENLIAILCNQGSVYLADLNKPSSDKVLLETGSDLINRTGIFTDNDESFISIALGARIMELTKYTKNSEWQKKNSNSIELDYLQIQMIGSKLLPNQTEIIIYGGSGNNSLLKIINTVTLKENPLWSQNKIHTSSIPNLVFSHDGTKLITTSLDNTCAITRLETAEKIATLKHDVNVSYPILSPDQQKLLVGDWNGFRLWDLHTGLPLSAPVKLGEPIRDAVFLDNGKKVRLVSMNSNITDWDLTGGPPRPAELNHTGRVTGYQIASDGEIIYTGDNNNTLNQWKKNKDSYVIDQKYDFHGSVIPVITKNKNKLFIIEDDTPNQLNVYKTKYDKMGQIDEFILMEEVKNIFFFNIRKQIAFDSKGEYFSYFNRERSEISIFNLNNSNTLKIETPNFVEHILFSPNGLYLFAYLMPDLIRVYDVKNNFKLFKEIRHKVTYGGSITFSNSSKYFLTYGGVPDGRLWRLFDSDIKELGVINHVRGINYIQFNDSESRLISGSQDNNAIVWEFNDTGIVDKSPSMLHENEVAFCTFMPGDEFNVLTINQSGKVRIWDYSLPAVILGPYSPGNNDRTSMFPEGSFIDNNDRFLSFNGQNKLRVWNIPNIDQDNAYKSDDLLNISELMLGWRNELKDKISTDDHEKSVKLLLQREGESAIKNYINWYYYESDQTRVASPYSSVSLDDYFINKLQSRSLVDIAEALRYRPCEPKALKRFSELVLTSGEIRGSQKEKEKISKWYLDLAKQYSN